MSLADHDAHIARGPRPRWQVAESRLAADADLKPAFVGHTRESVRQPPVQLLNRMLAIAVGWPDHRDAACHTQARDLRAGFWLRDDVAVA
jgi:hypothetical protein